MDISDIVVQSEEPNFLRSPSTFPIERLRPALAAIQKR
jgi:hypothetical protein